MRRIHQLYSVWAVILFLFLPAAWASAQSTDPANPSPLTSRQLKGNVFARDDTTFYYSFTAGPGDITFKLTMPNQEAFALVRLDALDQSSRSLLSLEASNSDREKSGSFSLSSQQPIIIRVRGARASAASSYTLNIAGIASFGVAPRPAPPTTTPVPTVSTTPLTIEITSPANGAEVTQSNLRVSYRVRGGTAKTVHLLVNGQRSSGKGQSVRVTGDSIVGDTMDVSLPSADSEISLIAEAANGAVSEPATIRVRWRGQAYQPKLYVLAVGVNAYKSKDLDKLTYPTKDAQDFVTAWNLQKGGLYQEVEVNTLTDVTRSDILRGFQTLKQKATRHDVVVILLSGHGVNDLSGRYFFMPVNGEPASPEVDGVSANDIKSLAEDLQGKVVFFLDTCHAGNALGGRQKGAVTLPEMRRELISAENGAVVFASSTGRQRSLENPEWKNGAFTKALIEGLSGKADVLNDGRITLSSLDVWITKRVKELTGGQQTPVMLRPDQVSDFPIAVRR